MTLSLLITRVITLIMLILRPHSSLKCDTIT
jgi:hypothetical protein